MEAEVDHDQLVPADIWESKEDQNVLIDKRNLASAHNNTSLFKTEITKEILKKSTVSSQELNNDIVLETTGNKLIKDKSLD